MRAKMIVRCGRCGYEYDPKHEELGLIQFVAKDGAVYTACVNCVEELGKIENPDERDNFIETFRR